MRAHRFVMAILVACSVGCLVGCGTSADGGSGSGAGTGGANATGGPGAAASDPSLASCDGSGGDVPAGFPAVGSSGCAFHAIFTHDDGSTGPVEMARDVGAQPVGSGRYDVSASTSDGSAYAPNSIRLRLPSLAAGDYTTEPSCAALEVAEGGFVFDSYGEGDNGGAPSVQLTIAGSDGTVVWGTFSGRLCAITQTYENPYSPGGVDFVYGCLPVPSGTFAARIETTVEATPMTPPLIAACSHEPGYPG
jgi:hypothetical protein